MRITFHSGVVTLDVDVTVVDPEVPIGDVVAAITGRDPSSSLVIDGQRVRATEAIGALPVRNGSIVSDEVQPRPHSDGEVSITRVAGERAGERLEVDRGTHDLGPSYDNAEVEPLLRLDVDHDQVEVERLTGAAILVDGGPLGSGATVGDGALIETADAVLRLSVGRPVDPVRLPLVDGGRVAHQRPPRLLGRDKLPPPARPA